MLLAASLLLALTGLAHSWLGERMLIGPLLASEHAKGSPLRSSFWRSLVRAGWHFTTVTWLGLALALGFIGTEPLTPSTRLAVVTLALMFVVMGLASLAIGRGRHPSWAAFLVIAALCMASVHTGA